VIERGRQGVAPSQPSAQQRQQEQEGGDVARYGIAGQAEHHCVAPRRATSSGLPGLIADPPEVDSRAPGFERRADQVVIADRGAAAGDDDVGPFRPASASASASIRSGTGPSGSTGPARRGHRREHRPVAGRELVVGHRLGLGGQLVAAVDHRERAGGRPRDAAMAGAIASAICAGPMRSARLEHRSPSREIEPAAADVAFGGGVAAGRRSRSPSRPRPPAAAPRPRPGHQRAGADPHRLAGLPSFPAKGRPAALSPTIRPRPGRPALTA
jgi:hypothetical protein